MPVAAQEGQGKAIVIDVNAMKIRMLNTTVSTTTGVNRKVCYTKPCDTILISMAADFLFPLNSFIIPAFQKPFRFWIKNRYQRSVNRCVSIVSQLTGCW